MEDRIQALWEQMNRGIPSSSNSNNNNNKKKRSFSSANPPPPPRKLSDNWIMNLGLIPKANTAASLTLGSDQDLRIAALWAQMNKPSPNLQLKPSPTPNSAASLQPKSDNWMTYLGISTKQPESSAHATSHKEQPHIELGDNDEARKLAAAAAAALSAVKDSAAAVASTQGRVEIKDVREFGGQEIEVRELVDANSKEVAEKAKAHATSAVDAVLEQIKKKPKLSVLDKTKKDWGEFKEENKGLEEELDAYKKSSNQYLDKVSFLERTDYREFERERDARLALQARRRPDMLEDP